MTFGEVGSVAGRRLGEAPYTSLTASPTLIARAAQRTSLQVRFVRLQALRCCRLSGRAIAGVVVRGPFARRGQQ